MLPALCRRNFSARVLVLMGCEDISAWREVVVCGARGVLYKSVLPDVLMRAIEKVAVGELWLCSDLLSDVFGQLMVSWLNMLDSRSLCSHSSFVAIFSMVCISMSGGADLCSTPRASRIMISRQALVSL